MMRNHFNILPIMPVLLVLALPCFGDDWLAFRGNMGRSGFSREKVSLPLSQPAWQCRIGGPIVSSPSVSRGVIYLGSRDSTLYAIDANTGSVNWKFKTGGWVDASPLVSGDTIVAGSRDGFIYLLGRIAGDTLGSLAAGLQLSSPGVSESGDILCGSGFPLNRFSVFSRPGWLDPWSVFFTQMSYSSPAVLGRMAVIGASDGNLYGVDLNTREVSWKLRTKGDVYLSTPAIVDSIVFFAPGDYDRNVYAVDLMNGTVYWKSVDSVAGLAKKRAVANPPLPISTMELIALRRLSPEARSQRILMLTATGQLSKSLISLRKADVNAADGFLSLGGGVKTSSVAVDDTRVYVIQKEQGYSADILLSPVSRFTLLALDAFTGAELWRFSEVRQSERLGYCSSPVVAGGKVFFGWGEGKVYALSAGTGEKLWEASLQGHIISSPAIADGTIYFATMSGNLYAYKLAATAPAVDFQRSTYCYPNPARGKVSHIQVYPEHDAKLAIVLYNSIEKPVFRMRADIPAGLKYTYDWNITGVANGVYFAVVTVSYGNGTEDRKILKVAVLH